MKLRTAVLPRVRRLVPTAERGLTFGLIGFVAAIEVAGTHAVTELHDLLAGTAMLAVGFFVLACHRSRPIGWVDALADRARRSIERIGQLKYDIGIDFRGTPLLPRKLPRIVPLTLLGMLVWIGLAFTAWYYFPTLGLRAVGVYTSYACYIVLVLLLWTLLAACICGSTVLPVLVLDQRLRSASERGAGPPDPIVLCGYFLLAVLVACVAPAAYGAGLCLVGAAVGFAGALLGGRDETAVLWRHHRNTIYAVPLRRLVALGLGTVSLGVFGLIAWACGGHFFNVPDLDADLSPTHFLGSVAAWLVPGMAAVGLYQWFDFRRTDPGRRSPPVVHLNDASSAAAAAVRRWGFRITAGARQREQVGLQLVHGNQSEATEFNPHWPLKVSLDDLNGTLVKERVARRDELQLRRQFFKALAKLVKQAKATAPTPGGGFLVAPQYWFIGGILWADPDHGPTADEDTLRALGQPFRRVMPVRARQHMHQILRATQIDAIYLEDGVSHRKLEKVLRAALELYDVHGGRRRAEDTHFQGIPKIRVIIHDYAPGNPFQVENYPEPKFDDVSRSRVLHIFKDRGGEEEPVESPFDFSWEPTPLMVS